MKILFLLLSLVCTSVLADINDPRFKAYQYRLKERRVYALQMRREISASRSPARGWTAIRIPYNPIGRSAIDLGRIYYPLPRRRYRALLWIR